MVQRQGQEILGQVSSLKDVVTELSSGQQALFKRQSELQGQVAQPEFYRRPQDEVTTALKALEETTKRLEEAYGRWELLEG